jgi:hypothetical protein
MFGGGLTQGRHSDSDFFEEIGNVDDGKCSPRISRYLREALERYFVVKSELGKELKSHNGEAEAGDEDTRVIAEWSGILGFSVDNMPWVGRLPEKVSGRVAQKDREMNIYDTVKQTADDVGLEVPSRTTSSDSVTQELLSSHRLAPPGEWIAAGYSGEGMVHAWMCGKALAFMVLGLDNGPISSHDAQRQGEGESWLREWFPDVFRVTEKRWRHSQIENLFASIV